MWAEACRVGGLWRVLEEDGNLTRAWLPWEAEGEPLDAGGFELREDAEAFALGVCYERALHGLIPDTTIADIDVLRRRLDRGKAPDLVPISVLAPPPIVRSPRSRRRVVEVRLAALAKSA